MWCYIWCTCASVRVRCPMHNILSASLYLHFGSVLYGWVTHTCCWCEHMCHSLFGQVFVPIVQPRACELMCSMPVWLVCASGICALMISEAKSCFSEEKGRAVPTRLRHLWCHAQAALCCSWRCLHPFLGLELQQLQPAKALCCLPSLLTKAADMTDLAHIGTA